MRNPRTDGVIYIDSKHVDLFVSNMFAQGTESQYHTVKGDKSSLWMFTYDIAKVKYLQHIGLADSDEQLVGLYVYDTPRYNTHDVTLKLEYNIWLVKVHKLQELTEAQELTLEPLCDVINEMRYMGGKHYLDENVPGSEPWILFEQWLQNDGSTYIVPNGNDILYMARQFGYYNLQISFWFIGQFMYDKANDTIVCVDPFEENDRYRIQWYS